MVAAMRMAAWGLIALVSSASGFHHPVESGAGLPAGEPPRGMVAFVDGPSCPPGWQIATIATGRLMVGTDQPVLVGRSVGAPLTDREDRRHTHGMAAAAIGLPERAIAAADGGNHNGAASGVQPLTGTVAPASSGLPFVQLTACVTP